MHTLSIKHQRIHQGSDSFKANAPVNCPGTGAGTGVVGEGTAAAGKGTAAEGAGAVAAGAGAAGEGTGTAGEGTGAAGEGTGATDEGRVAAGAPPGVLCGLMNELPAEHFCLVSRGAQLL